MSLNWTEMGSWSIKVGGTGIGDIFTVPEVWALIEDRKEFPFQKVLKETEQWGFQLLEGNSKQLLWRERQMLDIDCLHLDIGKTCKSE